MPAITGCSVLQSASCRHSFRLVDDRARLTGNSSVLAGCSTVQPSSRRPLRLQRAVPLSSPPPTARSDYSGLFHCPTILPPPTQITVGCSTVRPSSSHRPLRFQITMGWSTVINLFVDNDGGAVRCGYIGTIALNDRITIATGVILPSLELQICIHRVI